MITNKDIRVENGSLILNGDPYPLDGQSPETIMEIVEDNSDTTPTENSTAPVTSGGIYTAINNKISVVQPANEEVTVTGPYTDIAFTPPVETGYTFYLIGAVAINLSNWNLSNINPVAGSIRIYTSDTSSVTNQVKTTWLKIKNS